MNIESFASAPMWAGFIAFVVAMLAGSQLARRLQAR